MATSPQCSLDLGTLRALEQPKRQRLPGRFLQKVKKEGKKNGCWVWIGSKNKSSYGRFWDHGKLRYAHRYSYQRFNGKLLRAVTLHHRCNNKACVNPKHLDPMTLGQNLYIRDVLRKTLRHAVRK